jgi:putative transposase
MREAPSEEINSRTRHSSGRRSSLHQPNRRWIADFTYVWTAEGWLYVAAVIDLFSRRVVGWSMGAAMTAQLVTDALVKGERFSRKSKKLRRRWRH